MEMPGVLTYLEVKPGALSEDQWRSYHHLVFSQLASPLQKRAMLPLELFREQREKMLQAVSMREFYLLEDGKPLGRFIYGTYNQGGNEESPFGLFNINKDHYPEAVSRFLADLMSEVMEGFGHEKVYLVTWQQKNAELMRKWGADFGNDLVMLELAREQINRERLAAFSDEKIIQDAGLYAVRANSLPDAWMENYAQLNQVLFDDMIRSGGVVPQENSTRFFRNLYRQAEVAGQKWQHILLVDQEEKLAGFTLLVRIPEQPEILHQKMTVVRRDLRRNHLARWLKATVILDMLDQLDDWQTIRTECYKENFPIIRLNESLGFHTIAEKQEFVLTRKALQKVVEKSSAIT